MSNYRYRQQWTPAYADGQSFPRSGIALALAVRIVTWLRDEEARLDHPRPVDERGLDHLRHPTRTPGH